VNIALSVLMPRMALAAQSRLGLKRLVHAAVSALAAVSIPLTLGTLATAHLVVPWLMGASYAAAVSPVRWMAGYLVAAPVASLLSGTVLYALGKHRAYLASGTAGAITAVLLSLILVRFFGLTGSCVAFVLPEVAVGATAYLLMPSDLRDLWKNPIIAVAALASLLMLVVLRVTTSYTSRPLPVVMVGAAVYLLAAALMGRKLLIEQFGEAR
jgi:O-antigen/teichoic acid export membrane protein